MKIFYIYNYNYKMSSNRINITQDDEELVDSILNNNFHQYATRQLAQNNQLDSSDDENFDRIEDINNQQDEQSNISDTLRYQPNINDRVINAEKRLELIVCCLPLIYHHNYDDVKSIENSNKIILPKRILYEISGFDNIVYPLHFSLNEIEDQYFGVFEFQESIDHAYIPNKYFHKLDIEQNVPIKLTLINEELTKGKYVKIRPHTSNFLEIIDHKTYLENNLTKLYTCLLEKSTISMPYGDTNIYFDILECKPEERISIIDTDLEVDFDKPLDYVEPPKPKPPTPAPVPAPLVSTNYNVGNLSFTHGNNTNQSTNNQPVEFVPFSGVGHRLGDKND